MQQYAGEPRPRETIAILRSSAKDDTRLLVLDDDDIAAPIADDGRLHIELLPGKHSVIAVHAGERSPLLPFEALPDHVYRAAFADGAMHVFEVDRAKDTILKDVTIVAAPAPPPPAPPPPAPTEAPPPEPTPQ